jgi:pimeloyl-ACP methyl ester carboxylesterase
MAWTNPGRLGQYQADLAWLEDGSQLDRLGQIGSPCLAMAFEHDCWFPPRSVREAVKRIPGCQYAELPGQGHGAPLLAAGQVNPTLAKFLGQTRDPPSAPSAWLRTRHLHVFSIESPHADVGLLGGEGRGGR